MGGGGGELGSGKEGVWRRDLDPNDLTSHN